MRDVKGFTLIELIVVIIIISILGVLGIGLLSTPAQYSSSLSSKQWLTQLRSAQIQAMQKQSESKNMQFQAEIVNNYWRLSVLFDGEIISQVEVNGKDQRLAITATDFTTACNGLPSTSLPWRVYFDGLGRLVEADGSPMAQNQRFCFQGGSLANNLCLAPSGLAYEGDCIN